MVLSFEKVPEFEKDVKSLKKKWYSIPNDIEKAKLAITPLYTPVIGVNMQDFRDAFFGTNRATVLLSGEDYEVIKMRLDCATLGNNKKTRIVFIALITDNRVNFIELYAKNTNERENSRRIKKYMPK